MWTIRRNLLALALLSGGVGFGMVNMGCKDSNDAGKLPSDGSAAGGADGGAERPPDGAAGGSGGADGGSVVGADGSTG
jgi:hypothetical protein